MTSGLDLDHPNFPSDENPSKNLKGIAQKLSKGLAAKLDNIYGMKQEKGRWVYKTIDELKAGF